MRRGLRPGLEEQVRTFIAGKEPHKQYHGHCVRQAELAKECRAILKRRRTEPLGINRVADLAHSIGT